MHFVHDLAWLTYAVPPLSLDSDILELRYGNDGGRVLPTPADGAFVVCDLNRYDATATSNLTSGEAAAAAGPAGVASVHDLPAAAFDLVVLHGALDRMSNNGPVEKPLPDRDALLTAAYRALRPGGMIAVSGFNLLNPRILRAAVWRRIKRLFRTPAPAETGAADLRRPLTYWGYIRCLRHAGYGNPQVFNVIPDYLQPQHVVSAEREASTAYFRNIIEVRRANLSYPRYLFRRLLLHLNAFPYVERCYLIVAQK